MYNWNEMEILDMILTSFQIPEVFAVIFSSENIIHAYYLNLLVIPISDKPMPQSVLFCKIFLPRFRRFGKI